MISDFQGYPVRIRRKAFMRNMNLQIHMSGSMQITAGKLASPKQILKFLNQNKQWINTVQEDHKKVRDKYPRKQFIENESFPYLGNELPLKIVVGEFKVLKLIFFATHLRCELPQNKEFQYSDYRRALIRCYEKAGRRWLACRVDYWSEIMKLYPKKVSVRSQKTRWGSCSSEGHISLNWRLLAAPLPVLDYVVIHELAHLQHHNHSKAFWKLVEKYDGNHKYHRQWLRDHQWAFDFLAQKSELFP